MNSLVENSQHTPITDRAKPVNMNTPCKKVKQKRCQEAKISVVGKFGMTQHQTRMFQRVVTIPDLGQKAAVCVHKQPFRAEGEEQVTT